MLSIGVFFTLMIVGLAAGLPHTLQTGLVAHGVPAADATRISHLPPVATLFASFLGYNPMADAARPARACTACRRARRSSSPGAASSRNLISSPFHTALVYAFVFAIVACLIAAVASLLRGGKYHHAEATVPAAAPTGLEPVEPVQRERNRQGDRAYRIGEVAERVGVTTRTIRYYEELGLLGRRSARNKGTHRLYTDSDVARLRELIRLRDLLGLSLEELVTLAEAEETRAALRNQWHGTPTDEERAAILERAAALAQQRLDLVNARRRTLDEFAAELKQKLRLIAKRRRELERQRATTGRR